jgi:hypothetical protein
MPVPISNVTRRQVYAPSGAGGAGPYAFTFEILANTDIAVYKDDVLLTLTTHYTVTINANGTGSVTITASGLALAPVSPTQYAIVGNRTISRTTDFTTGGDFFANVLNDELDQQTIFAQQNAEGLQRALSAPQTDPTSINMTLPRASLRANKALGFDANGNPVISDTLGTNRGNWAAGTLYYVRDIVKDTTTNNIWQVITQHTSSGSQPINTNADSAKWTLLVDAASATASASAAASSASAASTSASNASTSASNASTSASNAASSASAASTSASNAAASYDSFDDRYLGAKASAPTLDNDGNALLTGSIYWDTTLGVIRVYSGTAWQSVNAPATIARTAITATASQTVLSVATYTPGINTMSVFVNGVKLSLSEYTETNANTVTLTTGLALNDEVEVFSYQVNAIGSLGASSVTFTQAGTSATARNAQVKLQEFISIKDFGAISDQGSSFDITAALNSAIAAAASSKISTIYIPGGSYYFNTQPNNITSKVKIVGDGRGTTMLYRNYSPASSDIGLFNFRDGCAGSVIEDMGISSNTGTTGGSLISLVASASSAPDFCSFSRLYLTGNNSHDWAVYVDGSARTGATIGVRDTFFSQCSIFGGLYGSVHIKSVVAFHLNDCDTFAAGGTYGLVKVTGTVAVPSYYVNVSGSSISGLYFDNCNYVMAKAAVIGADVTNASSANYVTMIGPCAGSSVQNNWTNSIWLDPTGFPSGAKFGGDVSISTKLGIGLGSAAPSYQIEALGNITGYSKSGSTTQIGTVGVGYTTGLNNGQTFAYNSGSAKLFLISTGGGAAALIFADYKQTTIALLSNPSSEFQASSTPGSGFTGIFKSANNHGISIKNNTGSFTNYQVLVLGSVSNTTDPF